MKLELRLWMNDVAKEDTVFVDIVEFSLRKLGFSSLSSLVINVQDLLKDHGDLGKFFLRYLTHS